MAKMQVYLSDELHRAVKDLDLPASALLQAAVRQELRRRELEADAWAWLAEMELRHGPVDAAELADARKWVAGLGEAS